MTTLQVAGLSLLILAIGITTAVAVVVRRRERSRAGQTRTEAINVLGNLALNSTKAQTELADALAGIRADDGAGLAEKLPQLALTSRRHEQQLGNAHASLTRLSGSEKPLAATALEVARQRDRVGALCRTAEDVNLKQPDSVVAALTTAVTDVLHHEQQLRDTVDDAKDHLVSRAAKLAGVELDPFKDPLTQLPNRRALLKQPVRGADNEPCRPFAVAVLVVTSPTDAEAGNGSAANDAMVAVAARIIRETVRGGDVVARTGEREFAIQMNSADLDTAGIVARACRTASKGTGVQYANRSLSFSFTWGVAVSKPESTLETVLAEAREAQSSTPVSDPGRLLSRTAGTVKRKIIEPEPEAALV